MPAIITRTPVDTERKDPGIGGKPPVDHRPTGGGGDGENWDKHPHGRRGPRELLGHYRLGLFFALAGDLMFFTALVLAFYVQQHTGHIDPANDYVLDWVPLVIPPILWINTAIILLSSITMEVARRQLFSEIHVMEEWFGLGRPAVKRAAPWLIATAVLGSLFLAGQLLAWSQLKAEGVYYASSPSSHFFYMITATHGLHLLLGVFALTAALLALFLAKRMEIRQIAVDCAAWYWHTMGILWIFLFGLLLFGQ
ncbi:MAG TPA: cytochrome c oxidase subunit 3 [Acidobacteriaceae bacterium]|jgi:cytochrome c oxidase subunit 3|nr:cytochrome c oxidase subunit 3 [Acidobacteriaceae bacterium]